MSGSDLSKFRANPHSGRQAPAWLGILSPGGWTIVAVALVAGAIVLARPARDRSGLEMWTFARAHHAMYEPVLAARTAAGAEPVNLYLLGLAALERRMLGGFLSGTSVADLIEAERGAACRAFVGPIEDVGFVDLTDRLREEGLLDDLNGPSFSPWTSRGRIFGIPHDVHPMMLVYRRDITEAAGIDLTQATTWEEFIELTRPLMTDEDGDGRPDRYALNLWPTAFDLVEALLLQADGGYFDDEERVAIDTPRNAHVLATIIRWCHGPERIAIDAPEFNPSGNQLKLEGRVIASLMPDWLAGIWKTDMPQLEGKLALMPIPAWEPGGRRTSVWGGTMLGIARTSPRQEDAWTIARELYLSEPVARELYRTNGIISPYKPLWEADFYDEPDPYFSGQAPGREFIQLAPEVPPRTSSPYNRFARDRVCDALIALRTWAEDTGNYDHDALVAQAHTCLADAENIVRRQIERNVFHDGSAP